MAGRPKKEEKNRRNCGVRVRLTKNEHDILSVYASEMGVSMSELIREKVMPSLVYDAERTINRLKSELL